MALCPIFLAEEASLSFNSTDSGTIDAILIDKSFRKHGEAIELTCNLIIPLRDSVIAEIDFESHVWIRDGLGELNPDGICASAETRRTGKKGEVLLKAI